VNPELRHLVNYSMWGKASIEAVAALLPSDDVELDALIAEAVRERNQAGFLYVTVAALARGRKVDARHLAGGAMMVPGGPLLGCIATHMEGQVPEPLLHAMQHTQLHLEAEAGCLLQIVDWCREHGGRPLPAGFVAHARTFARCKHLKGADHAYLVATAALLGDAGFEAVVMERHARVVPESLKMLRQKAGELGEAFLKAIKSPIQIYIPESGSRVLAQGYTMRRSVAKVGRNDLCPCGSGRKHKNCCIAKTEERLHFSTDVAGKTIEELQAEPEPHLTHGKILKADPHEAERWDPRKIAPSLRADYFNKLCAFHLVERAVEALELLGWTPEVKESWEWVLFSTAMEQRKDLAQRMMKTRPESSPIEGGLPLIVSLLLAEDDPAQMMKLLDERAMIVLQSEKPDELAGFAYAVMASKFRSIGIFVVRSMIPLLPEEKASILFDHLLRARDKLNLPPDDPFGDILDERFRKEDAGEGKEADALREAQGRLDAKAKEVGMLKEALERLQKEVQKREERPPPAATVAVVAPVPVDEPALRELRRKVEGLRSTLNERHNERNELRRELQKAHADLEVLRQKSPAIVPRVEEERESAGNEEDLFQPAEPFINQPVRIIEFPKRFQEGLASLPRAVARGTLTMLGRLAAGEPAAFVGVVRLKVCHGIFRQRIGSEFRLLFKLLPDRVQVVDLIPRQDLLRRIKTLK